MDGAVAITAIAAHPTETVTLRQRRGAVLMLVVAALLWSLNGPLIKILFQDGRGVAGLTIAAYRSLFAGAFLLPFVARKGFRVAEKGWMLATVATFTGMCATFVIATTLTQAANAIILQYTAPMWAVILSAAILKEWPTRGTLIATLIGLSGVMWIFLGQFSGNPAGLSVALSSGFIFGLQTVLYRRVRLAGPLAIAFYSCIGSALVLLPVAGTFATLSLTAKQACLLVFMGVVQFAVPYILYPAALRYLTATETMLIVLLEPVLNPVWTYLIVGEAIPLGTMIGGGVILGSVAFQIALLRASRSGRPTPAGAAPEIVRMEP